MTNDDDKQATATLAVSEEQLDELLTCAFEGGSTYWVSLSRYGFPKNPNKVGALFSNQSLVSLILNSQGWAILCDRENESKEHKLDRAAVVAGVQTFAELCPKQWADLQRGDCDAECGDMFLQCCLFGQVLYG